MTSPEELLAAAHATCFSKSLANELVEAGHPAPTSVETKADVTFEPGKASPGSTDGLRGCARYRRGAVPGRGRRC